MKEKYPSNPSKAVMKEHEMIQLICYHYNTKGYQVSAQKGRKQAFKEAGKWI